MISNVSSKNKEKHCKKKNSVKKTTIRQKKKKKNDTKKQKTASPGVEPGISARVTCKQLLDPDPYPVASLYAL